MKNKQIGQFIFMSFGLAVVLFIASDYATVDTAVWDAFGGAASIVWALFTFWGAYRLIKSNE